LRGINLAKGVQSAHLSLFLICGGSAGGPIDAILYKMQMNQQFHITT